MERDEQRHETSSGAGGATAREEQQHKGDDGGASSQVQGIIGATTQWRGAGVQRRSGVGVERRWHDE